MYITTVSDAPPNTRRRIPRAPSSRSTLRFRKLLVGTPTFGLLRRPSLVGGHCKRLGPTIETSTTHISTKEHRTRSTCYKAETQVARASCLTRSNSQQAQATRPAQAPLLLTADRGNSRQSPLSAVRQATPSFDSCERDPSDSVPQPSRLEFCRMKSVGYEMIECHDNPMCLVSVHV